jgi:hypothetical protein
MMPKFFLILALVAAAAGQSIPSRTLTESDQTSLAWKKKALQDALDDYNATLEKVYDHYDLPSMMWFGDKGYCGVWHLLDDSSKFIFLKDSTTDCKSKQEESTPDAATPTARLPKDVTPAATMLWFKAAQR